MASRTVSVQAGGDDDLQRGWGGQCVLWEDDIVLSHWGRITGLESRHWWGLLRSSASVPLCVQCCSQRSSHTAHPGDCAGAPTSGQICSCFQGGKQSNGQELLHFNVLSLNFLIFTPCLLKLQDNIESK